MRSATPTSRLAPRPKLGRASRTFGRLWQAPTFLAGLGLLLAVAVSAPFRKDPAVVQFEEDMEQLRSGLVAGGEPADTLIARADNLLSRLPKFTRKSAEVHFLAGSAYFRLAQSVGEPAAKEARARSLTHLEEAFSGGVPTADNPALFYRLGWVLYHHQPTEKNLERAIKLWETGIDKGADSPSHAYGLLVQAHLRRATPDVDAALRASQKQLERTDDREITAMAQARFTHAELLIRKEQRMEAIKELERVGAGAPKELRLQARLLQARTACDEGLWHRAIPIWKELLADAADVPGGRTWVLYHLGLCHQNAEPSDETEAACHWEEALSLGGEAGRAAGIRLGELRFSSGLPDPPRALDHWSQALAGLRSVHDYDGSLVPLEQARAWLENGVKTFLECQDYRRAEQLAQLYKKIADPGRANHLLAEALFAMASDTQERLRSVPEPLAAKKLTELRAEFHRAAVAYEEAATLLKEPAPVLWQSACCYLYANDHAHAVKVLDRFVSAETEEARLAEAWFSLAGARLALGEKDKARQAYYKCIEFPSTVFAYRARYELAVEEMDKKNFEQARDILKQNLDNRAIDRQTHEKSIYKMAALLLQMKQYLEASIYLQEASRQYPANALAMAARDQLAECLRKLAETEKTRMDASKSDDARAHHRRKRLEILEQVYSTYQSMLEDLEARGRAAELSADDQALFRRALFGIADARFDMADFAGALHLYESIQAAHRSKLESLVACHRIVRCVGFMIDSPEQIKLVRAAALKAVAWAREDLPRMSPKADYFHGPGVWSHEYWGDRLRDFHDALTRPLDPPGGPAFR